MKKLILFLALSTSFAHGACLKRGSGALNVLSMDVSRDKEIIINHPSLPYGCAFDDCAILRDDLFSFNSKTLELTWKRQSQRVKKVRADILLKMEAVSGSVDNNTEIKYFRSSDVAGVNGSDYYLLYTGLKSCVMVDRRYKDTPETDNCGTYSFEVFPVNSSTSPPLDFVRPDDATALWYEPGCSEDADPPAVGGGSEPPPE